MHGGYVATGFEERSFGRLVEGKGRGDNRGYDRRGYDRRGYNRRGELTSLQICGVPMSVSRRCY